MEALERVRKIGFRRWYERQLIESHAYFVTCFCCMILVAATLEASNAEGIGMHRLTMLFAALAGAAVGTLSWQRYRRILGRAEIIAEAAICPGCGAYGAFAVLDYGPTRPSDEADEAATDECAWLKVKCRRCAHRWTIP